MARAAKFSSRIAHADVVARSLHAPSGRDGCIPFATGGDAVEACTNGPVSASPSERIPMKVALSHNAYRAACPDRRRLTARSMAVALSTHVYEEHDGRSDDLHLLPRARCASAGQLRPVAAGAAHWRPLPAGPPGMRQRQHA